jgi:glycerol-3-phosphate dehydrogenase (NAD(P)+)
MKKYQTAIVVGAGAFGTSMAFILAHNFTRVILKVRSADTYDALKKGENKIYLPGQILPFEIVPAQDWDEVKKLVVGKVELVVSGLPTAAIQTFQDQAPFITPYLEQGIPFVSLSKGIDPDTLELPDEMYEKIFPKHKEQLMYLSGPSFAKEILDGQITLVSLAGRSRKKLLEASEMLLTNFFKVFPTYDIKGVLLGGALKNILAISGGIIEGLGYNHNTRAAMITRGIVEMLRFGHVFNARPETFYGLSGMGDLILTTTGDLSRNKVFGREIALGKSAEDIIASSRSVVEGYKTTKAAYLLSEKYEIRARLFTGMYKVLYENVPPKFIINEMMKLPSKFDGE